MSRMTDARLMEILGKLARIAVMAGDFDQMEALAAELANALKAERTTITNELEACCAATMRAGLATGHADNVLMLVEHILEQHEKTRTALTASEARVRELEGWIDRYCGQPDQTVVFNQFKAIQGNAEAAESRLHDLLEGLEGLIEVWGGSIGWGTTWQTTRNKCADDLQSLLTQTTPPVNSGGVGEGGGV